MPDGSQIDYDGLIPNNVGLADDLRVRKALETWHPGYIDWWKSMGPEGFQNAPCTCAPRSASAARAGRNSASSKCRNIAGASCSLPPSRAAPFRSARIRASRPGRKFRANIARCCAACWSSRATPNPLRWSSSVTSAPPRRHSTTCATCSRSTSRKAGTSGQWSICCRNISAEMAARKPRTCSAAAPATRTPPNARCVQRTDARLAVLFHVHLLHRPRRQDATRRAGAIRFRPAVAHLSLHADGGGASHVRRRDGRDARYPAYRRGDEGSRYRRSV